MKKAISVFLLSFLLLACNNNEGPFEVVKEKGIETLYSNNALAKGWVNMYGEDLSGTKVAVSNIEFNNGLPTGNFKIYNLQGNLIYEAMGQMTNKIFKGKIVYSNGDIIEGEIAINIRALLSYQGGVEIVNILDNYLNVTVKSKKNIKKYENGNIIEEKIYADKELKKLKTHITYLGDYDGTVKYAKDYYDTRKTFRTFVLNEDKSMIVEEFYKDGTLSAEGLFNRHIFKHLHEPKLINLTFNQIPSEKLIGTEYKDYSTNPVTHSNISLKCFKNDGISLLRIFDVIIHEKGYVLKYVDIKFHKTGYTEYRKEFDTYPHLIQAEYFDENGKAIKK